MHSLSGFEASHMPEAMMGMEAKKAMKFSVAVMLLLTPMVLVVELVTSFGLKEREFNRESESAREKRVASDEKMWVRGFGVFRTFCRAFLVSHFYHIFLGFTLTLLLYLLVLAQKVS